MIWFSALFGIWPWFPLYEDFSISRRSDAISPGLVWSDSDAMSRVLLSRRGRMFSVLRRFDNVGSIKVRPAVRFISWGFCLRKSTNILPPIEKPMKPIFLSLGMEKM